eukprot:9700638-Ditylum_brightwellii.AAC.1
MSDAMNQSELIHYLPNVYCFQLKHQLNNSAWNFFPISSLAVQTLYHLIVALIGQTVPLTVQAIVLLKDYIH